MKAIQLFFLLLSSTTAFSQNYYPFIQSGVYRDEFWASELPFACDYSWGVRYWLRGDSTVNGQTYQKLLFTPIFGAPGSPWFCWPYTVDTSKYGEIFALMREDTAQKRVFHLDFDSGLEYLLYDFSLNVGDSTEVGNPPQKIFVLNVWDDTWFDGSKRKRMDMETSPGTLINWTESLGNANNLWDPTSVACICPHGICYQKNGEILYASGPCATVVDAKEPEKNAPIVSLVPNPVADRMFIHISDGDFDRVSVIGFLGETLLEERFGSGFSSKEILVRNLPAGMYQAVLWKGEKRLGIKRFQKI